MNPQSNRTLVTALTLAALTAAVPVAAAAGQQRRPATRAEGATRSNGTLAPAAQAKERDYFVTTTVTVAVAVACPASRTV